MSDFNVAWSDSTLAMFRVLRGEVQKYGFMNVSLSLMLCTILHQTFVMSDYFVEKKISDDDLNSVIEKRYHLNCCKVTSKFKVRLPDDNESCSYAVKSSFVNNELESQFFEARNFDGSVISLLLQSNLMEILMKTVVRAQKSEIELVEPNHIIATMFDEDCSDLKEFFADLGLSYKDAKEYFEERHHTYPAFRIPSEFLSILSIMNDKVDISKPCEILGRDSEVNSCFDIMLKKDKHNVLIVGETGQGKSSLLEKITYDIVSQTSPSHFFGFTVVSLNVYTLLDEIENSLDNVKKLISLLTSRSDVIVCVEKISELAIYQEQNQAHILHILEQLWTSTTTTVIGTATSLEYEKCIEISNSFLNFEPVTLSAVYPENLYDVLKLKIEKLSAFHKVEVSHDIASYAIKIAFSLFARNECGFHSIVSLLDSSMATAKRLFHKSLMKEDIFANCYLSYDLYYRRSKQNNWQIAIHESGHYVVGKLCESLENFIFLAITIVPCNGCNGITLSLQDYGSGTQQTLDYFLDNMAYLLAGREAEKAFEIKQDSGSSGDLTKVTDLVFTAIDVLDLLGPSCRNEHYLVSTESIKLSQKTAKDINLKACELLEEATNRAWKIVNKNKDIIGAIADALLKQPVMTAEEIDKVWQDTVSKRELSQGLDGSTEVIAKSSSKTNDA